MNRVTRFFSRIGEQTTGLLRHVGSGWNSWWGRGRSLEQTEVDFVLARELYQNSNPDYSYGAGHCRRIIDGAVEFMGLPRASSDDEDLDDWLNDSIHEWWTDEIQQFFRNAMRDSKSVVRVLPFDWVRDPLVSADDSDRVRIEILEPERVRVYYDLENSDIVDRALIKHWVPFLEEPLNGQSEPWREPHELIHEITETITRDSVTYFDHTSGQWVEEWAHENEWGFVPVVEGYNEWDSTAGRGYSDFEAAFPFIAAFHDVMYQSLQAHQYHSIPKVKFRIDDVDTFIQNNFPDSWVDGTFNGTVNWKGKEILFLQSQEDADFLEAQSILGDSKTLMEFLFDCICMASETAAWVLMRTEQGTSGQKPQDAVSFIKRVERKRRNFSPALRRIFKMALVMSGRRPIHVKLAWDAVRPEDEAAFMQALQQLIMALEIAAQRGIISDETYRATIRPFIKPMKNPEQEAREAKSNVMLMETTMNGNGNNGGNTPVTAAPNSGGANE